MIFFSIQLIDSVKSMYFERFSKPENKSPCDYVWLPRCEGLLWSYHSDNILTYTLMLLQEIAKILFLQSY